MKTFTDLNEALANPSIVEVLQLRGGDLRKLPKEIDKLTSLVELDVSDNRLIELPLELGNLKKLVWLNVGENLLKTVPKELGELTQLKWMSIADNNLTISKKERVEKLLPNCQVNF